MDLSPTRRPNRTSPTEQDIANRQQAGQPSGFRTFLALTLMIIGVAVGYLVWSDVQMRAEYRELREQVMSPQTLAQPLQSSGAGAYTCTVLTGERAGRQYRHDGVASKWSATQQCDAVSGGACDCQQQ